MLEVSKKLLYSEYKHVPHYLEWTLFEVYLEEGIAALCGIFGKAEKPLHRPTSIIVGLFYG